MEKTYGNMQKAGNFTKNAVENFEENIVNKTNFLESIDKTTSENNNFNIKEKSNE